MKKNIFVLLFLVVFVKVKAQREVLGVVSNKSDRAKLYLKEALDLMKKRSVNSNKLNWDKIYKEANAATENVRAVEETYPIIKKAMIKLEDSHSKFFSPKQLEAYILGYRKTGQQFPEIKSAMIDGGYAYVKLPSFASFNFEEWDEYVNTFWSKIVELQSKHPKAWIIDIRDNEGGMFVPMYAAISPFLSQSKVVGWKDRHGKYIYMKFKNGGFYENHLRRHQLNVVKQKIKIRKTPIVILINEVTASSGEFAAISFVGQKNVSLVGTKTAGLTSANQEHQLSDGAFLVLTEGFTVDRNKRVYKEVGEGLKPDYTVGNVGPSKGSDDRYLKKAIDVIEEKLSAR